MAKYRAVLVSAGLLLTTGVSAADTNHVESDQVIPFSSETIAPPPVMIQTVVESQANQATPSVAPPLASDIYQSPPPVMIQTVVESQAYQPTPSVAPPLASDIYQSPPFNPDPVVVRRDDLGDPPQDEPKMCIPHPGWLGLPVPCGDDKPTSTQEEQAASTSMAIETPTTTQQEQAATTSITPESEPSASPNDGPKEEQKMCIPHPGWMGLPVPCGDNDCSSLAPAANMPPTPAYTECLERKLAEIRVRSSDEDEAPLEKRVPPPEMLESIREHAPPGVTPTDKQWQYPTETPMPHGHGPVVTDGIDDGEVHILPFTSQMEAGPTDILANPMHTMAPIRRGELEAALSEHLTATFETSYIISTGAPPVAIPEESGVATPSGPPPPKVSVIPFDLNTENFEPGLLHDPLAECMTNCATCCARAKARVKARAEAKAAVKRTPLMDPICAGTIEVCEKLHDKPKPDVPCEGTVEECKGLQERQVFESKVLDSAPTVAPIVELPPKVSESAAPIVELPPKVSESAAPIVELPPKVSEPAANAPPQAPAQSVVPEPVPQASQSSLPPMNDVPEVKSWWQIW